MKKNKVVIFTKEGGWVLINPDPKDYAGLPHLIDPDLSAVVGVSPEHWAICANKVVNGQIQTSLPVRGLIRRTILRLLAWIVRKFQ